MGMGMGRGRGEGRGSSWACSCLPVLPANTAPVLPAASVARGSAPCLSRSVTWRGLGVGCGVRSRVGAVLE